MKKIYVVVRKTVGGEDMYLVRLTFAGPKKILNDQQLPGESALRAAQRIILGHTGIFVDEARLGVVVEITPAENPLVVCLWAGPEVAHFPELGRKPFAWLPYRPAEMGLGLLEEESWFVMANFMGAMLARDFQDAESK